MKFHRSYFFRSLGPWISTTERTHYFPMSSHLLSCLCINNIFDYASVHAAFWSSQNIIKILKCTYGILWMNHGLPKNVQRQYYSRNNATWITITRREEVSIRNIPPKTKRAPNFPELACDLHGFLLRFPSSCGLSFETLLLNFHFSGCQAFIFFHFYLYIYFFISHFFHYFFRILFGCKLIFSLVTLFFGHKTHVKYLDYLKSTTCTLIFSSCNVWIWFVPYFYPG